MTIKNVKSFIAIFGDEYTPIMEFAHDAKGNPLNKHFKHLIKEVQAKKKEYPHAFTVAKSVPKI